MALWKSTSAVCPLPDFAANVPVDELFSVIADNDGDQLLPHVISNSGASESQRGKSFRIAFARAEQIMEGTLQLPQESKAQS